MARIFLETMMFGHLFGASDYDNKKPLISIWQSSADTTVDSVIADALIVQWREVHGINTTLAVPKLLTAISGKSGLMERSQRNRGM
jgi:hypothetical protein